MKRIVLASASPARSRLLSNAGIPHSTLVSGVNETAHTIALGPNATPIEIALALSQAKAQAVAAQLDPSDERRTYVIGCDSLLQINGQALGKPLDLEDAARRWQFMRGNTGFLHTGHTIIDVQGQMWVHEVASTTIYFGMPDDDEVLAYLATGESLNVAGAFTFRDEPC